MSADPTENTGHRPIAESTMIDGLSTIAELYDGFILDLWGVLHDGMAPYPGVITCLRQMKAEGKRVCLLSNAPRRLAATIAKLNDLGITRDLYDHVMTSGEATHLALASPSDDWHRALGPRLYHLGPEKDDDVLEDLPNHHEVSSLTEADVILNTGPYEFTEDMSAYLPVMREGLERKLPMICANPDLTVMMGPRHVLCAGALAAWYEEQGGTVRYHGKPHAGVYERCFALLEGVARGRILAVGDSLRTDIAGAQAAGIDGMLVTGGLHARELELAWGEVAEVSALDRLIAGSHAKPTWVAPGLIW